MTKLYISAIVAVAKNNVIGKDNDLLWRIPEDLKHFKKTTVGKPMVMGRKTYESLGKPLPSRPNIVISRSYKNLSGEKASQIYKDMEPIESPSRLNDGPFLYPSIDEGITAAKKLAAQMNVDEIMIIGGGEIYKQTMDMVDRLYLTRIEKDYDGDAFFPELNPHEWRTVSKDHRDGDPAFTFYVLERK